MQQRHSQIIMDGYDYAKVNGKGYSFIFKKLNIKGPWILPSMAAKGITNKNDQKKIIKYLVDEFNGLLKKLEQHYTYFHYIDLRNTFKEESEWHNEIHLNNSGYKKVAKKYHKIICSLLQKDPIEENKEKIIAHS